MDAHRSMAKRVAFRSMKKRAGVTLYRGTGASGDLVGTVPFVWFAFNRERAQQYADWKGGEVLTYEYQPKNVLDIGSSNRRMPVSSFLSQVIDISTANLDSVKDRALPLRKKIIDWYGDRHHEINHYWFDNSDVAEFIRVMGFDSILTTEGKHKTLGVLRDKVKIASSAIPTEEVQYHWDRGQGTSGFHTIREAPGENAPATKQQDQGQFNDKSIHDVEFADDLLKHQDGPGRKDEKDWSNLKPQFNAPSVPDNVRR